MPAIVVTIGLSSNVTRAPLPPPVARRFVRDVRAILRESSAIVYVDAAQSSGQWTDVSTGQTVREQSRTWVADVPGDALPDVADALSRLCGTYEQDAVALTQGETTLVTQGVG